ncbi:MAG TPA: hypothetical protein VHV08_10025 [Pirellulales bacterium]|jgi:hypothetical protein|nr:hypothetical protein [Pirellulales bacterium]
MSRKVLASLSIAAWVLGTCGISLGQVTLEHKFAEGSTFTLEMVTKFEQKLTIAGMETDTNSDARAAVKTTVGKRDVEGKLRVQQKIDTLQVLVGVMGQNYTFDSANPDEKGTSPLEMMRSVHKALTGQVTTIVYDKSNRATAVERDENALGAVNIEARELVKTQLDPENLKNEANESLDEIKSDPISKGDTWERVKAIHFGAGQIMDFKTQYTYQGTTEKDGKTFDKISSKALSVTFSLANSPLPFSVKSSDLKPTESEGVILFDRQKGQVIESNTSNRVEGDIVFSYNDKDLPAKLDLKMDVATTIKP